jgi:hypothetical protein
MRAIPLVTRSSAWSPPRGWGTLICVTRGEAVAEAERLNRAHPERERYQWTALPSRKRGWSVVRIPKPRAARIQPLTATTEAKPKPPQPDDPRSNVGRTLPYHGV